MKTHIRILMSFLLLFAFLSPAVAEDSATEEAARLIVQAMEEYAEAEALYKEAAEHAGNARQLVERAVMLVPELADAIGELLAPPVAAEEEEIAEVVEEVDEEPAAVEEEPMEVRQVYDFEPVDFAVTIGEEVYGVAEGFVPAAPINLQVQDIVEPAPEAFAAGEFFLTQGETFGIAASYEVDETGKIAVDIIEVAAPDVYLNASYEDGVGTLNGQMNIFGYNTEVTASFNETEGAEGIQNWDLNKLVLKVGELEKVVVFDPPVKAQTQQGVEDADGIVRDIVFIVQEEIGLAIIGDYELLDNGWVKLSNLDAILPTLYFQGSIEGELGVLSMDLLGYDAVVKFRRKSPMVSE